MACHGATGPSYRKNHAHPQKGTSYSQQHTPVALLNTLYKLLAVIIRERIQPLFDPLLHRMEFGFRQARSTTQAIHCPRRVLEDIEQVAIHCM